MHAADVHAHLRMHHDASVTPDGSARIVRRFEAPSGRAIEQVVTVRAVTVRARPWLLVFAEVCAAGEYDSATAVEHGASLAVGGLCLSADAYYLQHNLPLSATTDDLDAVVELLAHEAARMRAYTLAPVPTTNAVFAYLAE